MTTTKDLSRYERLTRRQVADRLRIHQDSVSRLMSNGLGAAVVSTGGVGNGKRYLWPLVEQFWNAWNCRRAYDQPCAGCALVLEDFAMVAAHLRDAGHGWGGCEKCDAPWLLDLPAARHQTRDELFRQAR